MSEFKFSNHGDYPHAWFSVDPIGEAMSVRFVRMVQSVEHGNDEFKELIDKVIASVKDSQKAVQGLRALIR